jgi:hypothetical protein
MSGGCPDCPLCGQPPIFTISGRQAFCGNGNCTLLLWDMSVSRDVNLLNAGTVKFPAPEDGGEDRDG